MLAKIKAGQECLMDGVTVVKVVRPLNRSNTAFSVEAQNRNILTVEASRLTPIEKLNPVARNK